MRIAVFAVEVFSFRIVNKDKAIKILDTKIFRI